MKVAGQIQRSSAAAIEGTNDTVIALPRAPRERESSRSPKENPQRVLEGYNRARSLSFRRLGPPWSVRFAGRMENITLLQSPLQNGRTMLAVLGTLSAHGLAAHSSNQVPLTEKVRRIFLLVSSEGLCLSINEEKRCRGVDSDRSGLRGYYHIHAATGAACLRGSH